MVTFPTLCFATIQNTTSGSAELPCSILEAGIKWSPSKVYFSLQAVLKPSSDRVFVIGGNSGINKRIDVIETEVYSPDFDQWTIVAPLTMGQSEAGACIVNDRIFIVGGYCWSARRCIKVIQVNGSQD